ncbi:hypothetical protein NC653_030878 [Populus alba x Populus x berolinensis]|uniref:Uncharacterized protein n=1 Tax=Populus alba x Populus x berolinensis TaxID=444605 RepID=A0AAD6Q0X8_9ROSI|nr:hypothetical protein NC653_030878 [Populus alba x Populus x berolinensis]
MPNHRVAQGTPDAEQRTKSSNRKLKSGFSSLFSAQGPIAHHACLDEKMWNQMPMKYFSYQYNDQIRMILAFDGSGEPGEFSFLFLPLRLIESQGTQKSVGCPNDHPGGIPLNSHLVLALPLPLPRYSLFFCPSIKLKNRDWDKNHGLLVKGRREKIVFIFHFWHVGM